MPRLKPCLNPDCQEEVGFYYEDIRNKKRGMFILCKFCGLHMGSNGQLSKKQLFKVWNVCGGKQGRILSKNKSEKIQI